MGSGTVTLAQGKQAGAARTVAGMRLRWCPAGRFRMGSPVGEEGRRADEEQVEVTLSRGFWMGQFEVTQGEWARVAGAFPQPMSKGIGDDYPMHWVSYVEAERFCGLLTEKGEGLRFRLPTEAQWEYACRAGTTTATAFGETMTPAQANFLGTTSKPVGSFGANAWGIHDMHGNEFEWCRDWYHARLPGGVDPDLAGRLGVINRDGTYSRVRRGGAWNDPFWACRSALRLRYEPERRSDHIGFRVMAEEA